MKKILSFTIALFAITFSAFGQYKTLVLNYEKSCFGQNEPLPSQKNFIITGVASNDIPFVEVNIYSSKGIESSEPIYSTFWKRDLNSKSLNFSVPINFNLREGKEYDVLIRYFRQTTTPERDSLQKSMHRMLGAYVDQAFKISDKELGLVNSSRQTMNDLNKIVTAGLANYRTRTSIQFTSFSDIVKLKLKQLDDLKLSKGSDENEKKSRLSYRTQMLNELKAILKTEANQYLTPDLSIMVDDKYINDYPTEKLPNYLPINVGYGGAILNSNFNNFNYAAAPYVGLSIPFGKEGGSAFWSKSSLSVGAFVSNMTDQNNVEYTGPIFKIPVYASLGYRAYRFVRINAGATFLENTTNNNLSIMPFVGISAEFNVSINLAK